MAFATGELSAVTTAGGGPPLVIRSVLHSFLSFDRHLFLGVYLFLCQFYKGCWLAGWQAPLVRLHLITSEYIRVYQITSDYIRLHQTTSEYIRLHQTTSDYFELLWHWSNKHRICTCIIVQATNYVYKFNFYGVALPVPLL